MGPETSPSIVYDPIVILLIEPTGNRRGDSVECLGGRTGGGCREARPEKVKYSNVKQWKMMSRNHVRIADYVKAFEKFATTEVALEGIEDKVLHAVRVIDRRAEDLEFWI